MQKYTFFLNCSHYATSFSVFCSISASYCVARCTSPPRCTGPGRGRTPTIGAADRCLPPPSCSPRPVAPDSGQNQCGPPSGAICWVAIASQPSPKGPKTAARPSAGESLRGGPRRGVRYTIHVESVDRKIFLRKIWWDGKMFVSLHSISEARKGAEK